MQGKNVLRKEPMGKEVNEDDAFVFNEAFASKFYKVKVGTISAAKESEPEKAETRHKVEEDRKPQARAECRHHAAQTCPIVVLLACILI